MLWLSLACTNRDSLPFEPAGPDSAPDPALLGPYPVGVRTVEVPFGDTRLVVELWYPASEEARGEAGFVYHIDDLLTPAALDVSPDIAALDVELPTDAVRDAVAREGEFPVVLFSHGAGGLRMQSTYLTVHLASHGHIIAAPDHPGSTLSDSIIAGSVDIGGLFASLATRTDELVAVRDALPSELDGADLERVGVAGHSFGALTAVRWLLVGQRADAIVAQALPPLERASAECSRGAWTRDNEPELASINQSTSLSQTSSDVQIQAGGLDATTPPENVEPYWVALPSPRGRLDLSHAGHFTFSDMCLLDTEAIAMASFAGIGDALGDGCAPDNTDPDTAIPAIRHFATAHLNAVLRDSPPSRDWLSQAHAERLAPGEASYQE